MLLVSRTTVVKALLYEHVVAAAREEIEREKTCWTLVERVFSRRSSDGACFGSSCTRTHVELIDDVPPKAPSDDRFCTPPPFALLLVETFESAPVVEFLHMLNVAHATRGCKYILLYRGGYDEPSSLVSARPGVVGLEARVPNEI